MGDNLEKSPIWSPAYQKALDFAALVNSRSGDVEVLRLTDAGLQGNTHIPFAEFNNEAVAQVLFGWLERKSLQ